MRYPMLVTMIFLVVGAAVHAGCGLFTVRQAEVDHHTSKVFIDWDPETRTQAITLQLTFEGDTRDVGMVIPTPGRPKLEKMPPDFFDWLETFTTRYPAMRVIESPLDLKAKFRAYERMRALPPDAGARSIPPLRDEPAEPVAAGRVGHLAYKIFPPEQSADFHEWLSRNKYFFIPGAAELRTYLDGKWFFTVMKIAATGLEPGEDGRLRGVIEPLRLTFSTENPVYPLRISQVNCSRKLDVTFFIQAPEAMDLPDDWSWSWAFQGLREKIEARRQVISGFRPTRLEWAKRLDATDQRLLEDPVQHYGDPGKPRSPQGVREVTLAEVKNAFWSAHARQVGTEAPPEEARKELLAPLDEACPESRGKFVQLPGTRDINATFLFLPRRAAPADLIPLLSKLKGILKPGRFLTRFSKRFYPEEVVKDPDILPALEETAGEYISDRPDEPQ